MVYFSESIGGFIPSQWKDDGTYTDESWPSDAVLLTENEANQYWRKSPPDGKVLGSVNGHPTWVDFRPSLATILNRLAGVYKSDIASLNNVYLSALVSDGPSDTTKQQSVRDQILSRKTQYISDTAAAKAAYK
ncbi:TPA: tail assembly chaperone [Yersinia enterocolitica]|nr:tail assembly chaperone [Yersinia enterocolitica]